MLHDATPCICGDSSKVLSQFNTKVWAETNPNNRFIRHFGQLIDPHPAFVRRAIELIDAKEDPVPISRLCFLLRVSQRTLHFAFMDQTSEPPSRYFRLRRMNRSRRMLRRRYHGLRDRQGIRVPRTGCYAVEYKRLFGESPSETFRAAEPGATVSPGAHFRDRNARPYLSMARLLGSLQGVALSSPPLPGRPPAQTGG